MAGRPKNISVASRFWEKVDFNRPEDECWPWTGGVFEKGYGKFELGYKTVRSHRVAYELSSGQKIPDKMQVLHSCDNPRCCNPNHLFLGTNAGNRADSCQKGRHTFPHRRKLHHGEVWLMKRLRCAGISYNFIAKMFKVSYTTAYKHINDQLNSCKENNHALRPTQ